MNIGMYVIYIYVLLFVNTHMYIEYIPSNHERKNIYKCNRKLFLIWLLFDHNFIHSPIIMPSWWLCIVGYLLQIILSPVPLLKTQSICVSYFVVHVSFSRRDPKPFSISIVSVLPWLVRRHINIANYYNFAIVLQFNFANTIT